MFPTVLVTILLLQGHPRLAVLLLPLVLLHDVVDLVVDGLDVVLLDAQHALGENGSMLVGEVEVGEGLGSCDELGSTG